MSDQDAVTAVAEGVARTLWGDGAAQAWDSLPGVARQRLIKQSEDCVGITLDALQGAGYAVVKLPEPDDLSDDSPCPQCGRGPMEPQRRGARPSQIILECSSCGWPTQVYC